MMDKNNNQEVKEVKQFDVMIIFRADMAEDQKDERIEKVRNLAENNGGKYEETNDWGKKRLAYEIDGQTHGWYFLLAFTCTVEGVRELDRIMKIDEGILRHMIIRKG